MNYRLTLKFNKNSVLKKDVQAENRGDLDKKLKLSYPFLHQNRDRIKVEALVLSR